MPYMQLPFAYNFLAFLNRRFTSYKPSQTTEPQLFYIVCCALSIFLVLVNP